ncbi:unnamed protein product [Wuchereria bancrofti]|uniref:Uncharacterized protein n=1 Tax=Wuchereria bancrofti TaxID=6293 RepID=A0A3P7EFY2_WUCBA|nr:unnamed protein product [Wuchereria bancrofti]
MNFQRQQYVKKWSHPGIHLLNLTNLDDGTNWMMDDGTNWMILIRLYEFLLTAVEKMTARLRRPYQCISTRFDITGIIKAFNTVSRKRLLWKQNLSWKIWLFNLLFSGEGVDCREIRWM